MSYLSERIAAALIETPSIKNISYSAIVLDEQSKRRLLETLKDKIPHGWEPLAHHMTLKMGGLPENLKADIGKDIPLTAEEIGISDKALAVKVSGYKPLVSQIAHITVAVNRAGGGKPKDSNAITNWEKIHSIPLMGTMEEVPFPTGKLCMARDEELIEYALEYASFSDRTARRLITAFKVNRTLYNMCDYLVLHDKEDHKYGFLPENKPAGLIKDMKGRVKGSPYEKSGEKIYDVVIDMYEDPRHKDPEGDLADIWVGSRKDAEEQVKKIRSGKGGGTHFVKIIDLKKQEKTAYTEYLDRIASELEGLSPWLALAVDRVSDDIDREAGILTKVKEKATEWKDKFLGFFKKNKDKIAKEISKGLRSMAGKAFNAILSKSGIALKVAQTVIAKSKVDPKAKSEIAAALSGKDPVVVLKNLNELRSKFKITAEDEKQAKAIAEPLTAQIKTASSERDLNAIIASMVDAGMFDNINLPSVLLLVVIMILVFAVFAPVAAAVGDTEGLKNVVTWTQSLDVAKGAKDVADFIQAYIIKDIGSHGEVLKSTMHVLVADKTSVLHDIWINTNTPQQAFALLDTELKNDPTLLKQIVSHLAVGPLC